ncbi:dUTP pyrophosphatase [Novimethylophilus kurashikiensis]|uniref:Deoxyuridine 5'-triphosphate nucleotidohydrolase n=1 Tax=Novimethylophilus kurashikiensis TaxID=1825523 RepID=A0A2R5F8F3_9PROT|nr:dUTP diphosphatase [Novimethylophilus kurashikiensis]GBG14477.1 dUTP pyrophosphatase [Novimethylophilus kurashikiensis]
MRQVKAKILDQRLKDDPSLLPTYANPGDAGMDLRACITEPLTIEPGDVVLVPTGLAIYIEDPTLVGLILPRSGLGHKQGLVLGNGTGVIDAPYQGQLQVSVWNRSKKAFTIQPLDRIAQYVVMPVVHVELAVVDEFEASARGEGGFGSSGHQ